MCCSGTSCCNGKCRCICLRCRDCEGCGAESGAGLMVGMANGFAGGLMKSMSSRKKPNPAIKPDLPGAFSHQGQEEESKSKTKQSVAMVNAAKSGCTQS